MSLPCSLATSPRARQAEYQDHNVVLPVLVEILHQRGEGGEFLGIEGEVAVPIHVIDVVPLRVLWGNGSEAGGSPQTPSLLPPRGWGGTCGIWKFLMALTVCQVSLLEP